MAQTASSGIDVVSSKSICYTVIYGEKYSN
jgi:hypothetical protein